MQLDRITRHNANDFPRVPHNTGAILSFGNGTQKVYSTSNSLACDALRSPTTWEVLLKTARGIVMRKWIVVGLIVLTALLGTLIARSFQSPGYPRDRRSDSP